MVELYIDDDTLASLESQYKFMYLYYHISLRVICHVFFWVAEAMF